MKPISSEKEAGPYGKTTASSNHHGHFAVLLPGGPDGDLHVLAEGRQKFHEPASRETAGAVTHEQGHVRLLDAERLGGSRLRKPRC
jgi:hypothetical protein